MAETLQRLRKSAGYSTQDSFAEALGLKGRAVIAKWETGASYPRARLIPRVAKLLNVTEGEVIAAIEATKKAS